MTVYVDPAVWPYRRMMMCHMWADDLDELFAMADRIGVNRRWLQGHPTLSLPAYRNASWVHFDIGKGKRALAVRAGAIETDRYGPLEWEARRRLSSLHRGMRAQAQRQLDAIARARAMAREGAA